MISGEYTHVLVVVLKLTAWIQDGLTDVYTYAAIMYFSAKQMGETTRHEGWTSVVHGAFQANKYYKKEKAYHFCICGKEVGENKKVIVKNFIVV